MPHVISFTTETGQTVFVEAVNRTSSLVVESQSQINPATGELDALFETSTSELVTRSLASDVAAKASESFEAALSAVSSTLESVYAVVEKVTAPIDEIQVQFGLKLTAGAHAIVSAGTEANFQFTVTWKPHSTSGSTPTANQK